MEIWGLVEGGHDMDRLNNSVSLSSVRLFLGLMHNSTKLQNIINIWKQPIL